LLSGVSVAGAAAPRTLDWSVREAPEQAVKAGSTIKVTLAAKITPGWHLYALEEPEGGPTATEVGLGETDAADLLSVTEGEPELRPDPVLKMPVKLFEGRAAFTLRVRMDAGAKAGPGQLHVLVRYQSCNDRMCLPPRTDTVVVPVVVER
jgi:DsbC/DsbD-like thiol-disulfide interchange protein